ncbi:DUF3224 domain-containing protein [Conexibacter sp. JD483]|uniref:DUF3224 domain-containing protein n=1 Tax=unclassified Conexibacter TaxID=2627773 RepID=UPI0027218EFA|nr:MULTISPECIES: DUF3224 domain-containing protein [unclassified Conexibacter]MDO8185548.1 DUF3224 domain-containing protein [Conexibacter sp. CPCC 205706]MDO8197265.1 DUF3224 domain-containing protein [Conexibacter sp. CPCC 205762]MDR9371546.1 DUF3224 domain-containing protein [Conexibacter sp. JD483]
MTEIVFEITRWEEAGYDAGDPLHLRPPDGPLLARVLLAKRYTGPLEGEAVGEVQTCDQQGYIAMERITGVLDGRRGSFVLQHGAAQAPDGAPLQFGWIVPQSGTGELAGIAGSARVAHERLTLDYVLPGD